MNDEQKVAELVDNLMMIFSTETPAFAIQVLSITTGIVVGHCDPSAEEFMMGEFNNNAKIVIAQIQGSKANETH